MDSLSAEPPGTYVSIQETRVQSLGREDPTNLGATEPVCAAPPLGLRSGACAPQGEKVRTATREEPRSLPARESPPSNEDPAQPEVTRTTKNEYSPVLGPCFGGFETEVETASSRACSSEARGAAGPAQGQSLRNGRRAW